MPDWIDNNHAGFVIAAYVVAFVVLAGLGILSRIDYYRRVKEWQKIKTNDNA